MKKFDKKVDLRSRKAMTEFLTNHFRYDTMSPWNQSTSYANNIKIHRLGLDRETENKLYDLIETTEFWDDARVLFDEFAERHGYQWRPGINGRSGGYLVLYQSFREPSEHKSFCISCGQKNFTSVAATGNVCGKCGKPTRVDYKSPPMNVGTYPGKATDMDEDFTDFSMYALRERVKLVQDFDRVTDALIALAVKMVSDYSVENETYFVPKTRKVLVGKCV
jgi:hypothetical protein